ncbi:hypothetical protein SD074_27830 [Prolixibacter sp. SD074]|nr:hypothetical protein SD074_27830 [Prolixibacter sp. SD074]
MNAAAIVEYIRYRSPATDFDLCLSFACFDFILRLEGKNGILYLNRIDSGMFELENNRKP